LAMPPAASETKPPRRWDGFDGCCGFAAAPKSLRTTTSVPRSNELLTSPVEAKGCDP
jgi:hypothetical protein